MYVLFHKREQPTSSIHEVPVTFYITVASASVCVFIYYSVLTCVPWIPERLVALLNPVSNVCTTYQIKHIIIFTCTLICTDTINSSLCEANLGKQVEYLPKM